MNTLRETLEAFKLPLVHQSVTKHQVLVEQGQVSKHLYFIKKGALRLGHLTPDGKEVTTQFFFEGNQVALIESFAHGTPSEYFLESLEETELLMVNREDFMEAVAEHVALKDLMIELLLTKMTTYSNLFLSRIQQSPEERYRELQDQYAELLNRVEDQYLASYLGITPVSFSRIKKRLT